MTNGDGFITGVTEGLNTEQGLHSKFFRQSDNLSYNINLSLICPDLLDPEIEEQLINGGRLQTFDTRDMLNFVELELLTAEEVYEVQSKLGIFQAYV